MKNHQGPTTEKGVNWGNDSHNLDSNWRRQKYRKNKQDNDSLKGL